MSETVSTPADNHLHAATAATSLIWIVIAVLCFMGGFSALDKSVGRA